MSTARKIIVQTFVAAKKGRLETGRLRECKTVEQAKSMADTLVATATAAGAIVIIQNVAADDEFGFAEEPILVGYVGRVPPGVEEAF